jgi:16S rRNA G966 N2-methylase RsmD
MNHLYYGDNLDILRADIRDESIDLIYLDPPFNSQATYNVLFRAPTGERSQAQIGVFCITPNKVYSTVEGRIAFMRYRTISL